MASTNNADSPRRETATGLINQAFAGGLPPVDGMKSSQAVSFRLRCGRSSIWQWPLLPAVEILSHRCPRSSEVVALFLFSVPHDEHGQPYLVCSCQDFRGPQRCGHSRAQVEYLSLVGCHRAGHTLLHGRVAFLRKKYSSRRDGFFLSALVSGADFLLMVSACMVFGFFGSTGFNCCGEASRWISALSVFVLVPLAVSLCWPPSKVRRQLASPA